MTLLQSNTQNFLLKSPAKVQLLTALEKVKDQLGMTSAAASMDMSKEAKGTMEVLSEALILVCYIYDEDLHDIVELHKTGARVVPTEVVNLLQCNHFYEVRKQSELQKTSHDLFEPSDRHDFYNLTEKLMKPSVYGRVILFALQCSS